MMKAYHVYAITYDYPTDHFYCMLEATAKKEFERLKAAHIDIYKETIESLDEDIREDPQNEDEYACHKKRALNDKMACETLTFDNCNVINAGLFWEIIEVKE